MRLDRKRLRGRFVLLAWLSVCALTVFMSMIGVTFQVFDGVPTEQIHAP
jgi:hypothetical protein